MQRTLIVIDAQIDFCDVPGAALPVNGAVKDVERISSLIDKDLFDSVFSSIDSHYSMDISHPKWWIDSNGNTVNPFTLIKSDDILNGKFNAIIDPVASLKYVQDLENNKEFLHFIWPEHCLMGTTGGTLHPTYMAALNAWMHRNKKWVTFINKGVNPFTEHFGIFRANVPVSSDASTQINQNYFNFFSNKDEIVIVGEARTHCVANSLKQMLEFAPQLASKILVLEDCMSDVGGLPSDFYASVDKIYSDAYAMGVRKLKSTDL